MSDLVADIYRQNEWANLALINACRGLTEEQLDATSSGTYGSIRDTLRHIVSSETGYAFRPGDVDIDPIAPGEPWPGFDRLSDVVRTTAVAATRHASGRPTISRVVVDSDQPSEVDLSVILIQMVNHSTDHRSQINTIFTILGIEPPDLSSWAWGLADGRVTCGLCGSPDHYGVDHEESPKGQ